MRMAVEEGRAANPSLHLGICGEHGGDPASVVFCHELGLDYVSCSPFRVETARLAAGQAAVGDGRVRIQVVVGFFEWQGIDLERLTVGSLFIHGAGDATTSRIAGDMFREGVKPDEEDQGRLARSRWLERNRAEYSFPCGVVPQPEPGPREPQLNVLPTMRRAVVPVIAAVLPLDLVFVLEQDSRTSSSSAACRGTRSVTRTWWIRPACTCPSRSTRRSSRIGRC